MNTLIEEDAIDISFADTQEEMALVEVSKKLALEIESSRIGNLIPITKVSSFVKEIRQLGMGDLLSNAIDMPNNTANMLFLLAEALATSDVSIAWKGLNDIPANLLRSCIKEEMTSETIAFPYGAYHEKGDGDWVMFWPEPVLPKVIFLWDSTPGAMCRVVNLPMQMIPSPLLGFTDAVVLKIDSQKMTRPNKKITLDADNNHYVKTHLFAMISGLLSGALQRLVVEAYSYANTREAFGKPIAQHQAVAVRLADIALNRDATRLCLLEVLQLADLKDESRLALVGKYVSETACDIARDAVQIAAAHGYVEGLPFKRLFEQTRTLSTMLSIMNG